MPSITQNAKTYSVHGLISVPLYIPVNNQTCSCPKRKECQHPGKHPRGREWNNPDADSIAARWKRWPQSNIGILTGEVSGIIVLDIDPRNGGDTSLAALIAEHGALPPTPTVRTGGGGTHYYFRYATVQNTELAPGIDLLGNGKSAVAPPSLHVTGNLYAWEDGKGLDDIPLADLPPWIVTLAQSKHTPQEHVQPVAKSEQTISKGARDTTLFKLGASLRSKGLSIDAIAAALQVENAARCDPPLPADEVVRIAQSCQRYEQGQVIEPQTIDPFTLPEFIAKKLKPIAWCIPGLLAEGAVLLGGRPKQGKSFLALQLCIAKAADGAALGMFPAGGVGDTLYLALEDGERRVQTRVKDMVPSWGRAPERCSVAFQAPKADHGLFDEMRRIMDSWRAPGLFVVDILARVRSHSRGKKDVYLDDYELINQFMTLGQEYSTTILIVTHTTKAKYDDITDVFDTLQGTTGNRGGTVTNMILQRGQDDAGVLHLEGKDIGQMAYAMRQEGALWYALGDASAYQQSAERLEVLELLYKQGGGFRPQELADSLGKGEDAMRKLIQRMRNDDLVTKRGQSYYMTDLGKEVLINKEEKANRPQREEVRYAFLGEYGKPQDVQPSDLPLETDPLQEPLPEPMPEACVFCGDDRVANRYGVRLCAVCQREQP